MGILETLGICSSQDGIITAETIPLSNGNRLVLDLLTGRIVSSRIVPAKNSVVVSSVNVDYNEEISLWNSHSEFLSNCFASLLMAGFFLIFVSPFFISFITWNIYSGMVSGEIILGCICYYYGKKSERSIMLLKQQRDLRDHVREWRNEHGGSRRSATTIGSTPTLLALLNRHTLPIRQPGMTDEEFINTVNERLDQEIRENEVYATERMSEEARTEAERRRIHTRWEDIDVVTQDDLKEGK